MSNFQASFRVCFVRVNVALIFLETLVHKFDESIEKEYIAKTKD